MLDTRSTPGGRGAPWEEFERLSSFQTCPPPPQHRAVPPPMQAPQLSSWPAETTVSRSVWARLGWLDNWHLDSPCSKKRWQNLQGVMGDEPSVCFLSQAGDAPGQGGLQPGRRPLEPEASLPEPHSILFHFISIEASLMHHVT